MDRGEVEFLEQQDEETAQQMRQSLTMRGDLRVSLETTREASIIPPYQEGSDLGNLNSVLDR